MTAINWTKTDAGFSFADEATSSRFEIVRANRRFRLLIEGEKYGKDGSLTEKKEIAETMLADRKARIESREIKQVIGCEPKDITVQVEEPKPVEEIKAVIVSDLASTPVFASCLKQLGMAPLTMPAAESRTSPPTPKAAPSLKPALKRPGGGEKSNEGTAFAERKQAPKPKAKQKPTGMPNNAPVDPILKTNHPDYVAPDAIEYLGQYGYTEETVRAIAQAERAKIVTKDTIVDIRSSPNAAFAACDPKDQLFIERRAAISEGRDPNLITPENVVEVNRQRMEEGKVKKIIVTEDGEKIVTTSKVAAKIANAFGVEVTQSETGKYSVAGESLTSLFRWMGFKGWTHEQALATMQNLGIAPEAFKETTLRLQMNSGKKGEASHYGPVPTLSDEQAEALERAAGKAAVAPVKAAPKPKAAK